MSSGPAEAQPAAGRLVLGTAGHIDHGKTALVRALTGVDTDRLPEEKARGITIDLGFAPLDLPGIGRVSVVDVPGHEGLVRTMVAGATGIDVLLLVIAADEGVMPQTREHVAICELLGVRHGVVAITKADLVDEETVELASLEVRELLAGGPLAEAPVIPVSARTGHGVERLREALAACLERAAARTPRSGPPRLFVDRVFAVRGFGTVVTGTLQGSALAAGEPVELLPSGRTARARSLQSHGQPAERVEPGARCAVNLQGLEVAEVARGELVTRPGALRPGSRFDVRLRWLPGVTPLRDATSVMLLVGTAERLVRVLPIGAGGIAPGEEGFARIHLAPGAAPLALLPRDRFVLRGFARTDAAGYTLAGGEILDIAPPRRRRSDPALRADLERLAAGDLRDGLRVRIGRAGLAGTLEDDLRREVGLGRAEVGQELEALVEEGSAVFVGGGRLLGRAAVEELEGRLLGALRAYHEAEPLRPGMPVAELRGRLPENVDRATAEAVVARLAAAGRLRTARDEVALPEHRPTLTPEQMRAAELIAKRAGESGLTPPTFREWQAETGLPEAALRDLLAHLEREGRLVRAPGDLWFDAAAVADLERRVVAHLREHGSLDTAGYKALIGATRRHVVPLMELLDARRVTFRRGDVRVLGRR